MSWVAVWYHTGMHVPRVVAVTSTEGRGGRRSGQHFSRIRVQQTPPTAGPPGLLVSGWQSRDQHVLNWSWLGYHVENIQDLCQAQPEVQHKFY